MESWEPGRNLFVASGQEAVNIRMVYSPSDVISPNTKYFKPVLTHQVFGPKELIFGYRNLIIDIYYSAISGICYVDLKHTEIIAEDPKHGIIADDIFDMLRPWLPKNFCTDKNEYLKCLGQEKKDVMYGNQLDEFKSLHLDSLVHNYKIHLCATDDPAFADFHERFQTLIIFFIDAANYIDISDPKWMIFYMYEERHFSKNRTRRYPIGFCTVYKFFAYPNKIRPRISQFFILPTFQRMGLGSRLLQAVYDHILEMPNVTEITVESPNAGFTKMRDIVDTRSVMRLPNFKKLKLAGGFTKDMAITANRKLKLNNQQTMKVYQILLLYHSDTTVVFANFVRFVKQRIRRIYQRQYNAARRRDNKNRTHELRQILDSDFMTNETIHNKFNKFLKEIQPVVDSLHVLRG